MEISRDDLARHYASLSDEELLAIDQDELTDLALGCYKAEISRRHFDEDPAASPQTRIHTPIEVPPDWLDTAASACSFAASSGRRYAEDAERACNILLDAGIPAEAVGEEREGEPDLLHVMVPGALSLKAASILDRDLFNEEMEESWRTHFEELSDEQLRALHPDDLCAGLLDRAARLKRVYEEALAQRSSD